MFEESDDALASLIARTALKDHKAFKQLYDLTAHYLNGVTYRILGNLALSEESLQEAYLQVWKNAHSYRPTTAKPMTWLISIARYRAIDKLAKQQPTEDIDDHTESSLTTSAKDTPEMHHHQLQMQHSFMRCFKQLDEQHASCLKMAYLEGKSREAIAVIMATKVNTVKSWLRRAQEKLKLCLTQ